MQIAVDRDFARFGAKSYVINKINTVELREVKLQSLALIIAGGIGVLALGAAINSTPANAGLGAITAMIAGGIAVWAAMRMNIIDYKLLFVTSPVETQALMPRNGEIVSDLANEIEQAMVGQP